APEASDAELPASAWSLGPLAPDQLGQVADQSHRVAHEEAAQRRHAIDGGEACVTHQADRLDVVGEQPVQKIGRGDHGEVVGPPPLRVALQRVAAADVEAKPLLSTKTSTRAAMSRTPRL